jgi:Bacterial transglutaminase-like N-terminal region
VALGEHRVMFRPRDSYDQRLIEARLAIQPAPSDLRWLHDAFGNCVAVATFDTAAVELRFESEIKLEHTPSRLSDLQIEPRVAAFPFSYDEDEVPDLLPYIIRRYPDSGNEVRQWVNRFLREGRPNETGALLMTLTAAIQESWSLILTTDRISQLTRDHELRAGGLGIVVAMKAIGDGHLADITQLAARSGVVRGELLPDHPHHRAREGRIAFLERDGR